VIISPSAAVERRLPWALAGAAGAVGAVAWVGFLRLGLVLSHYDAKAHLVVARRVIDSLTPGWQQIGAVWLPLPHLIQILPSQIDFFYRTGVSASFVSVACLATTTYALARLVLKTTGSSLGAVISAALLVFNPNLLYLHTTPMTEPLLLATTTLVVLWLTEWVDRDVDAVPVRLGMALFAATWTRYEAWAIVAAALVAAGYAMWRRGAAGSTLLARAWRAGIWPATAVAIFLVNSRITVGAWFVSDGFYVPDPTYAGQLSKTLLGLWWGTHQLSGYGIATLAVLGTAGVAWRALRAPEAASEGIGLALFAALAVPFVAFYDGHPYRIRYMVPAVGACALFGGLAVGHLAARHRARAMGVAAAVALCASLLLESPPWDTRAPLLLEAQWDHAASVGRRSVTACLAAQYHQEKILASMGSLAHYMQELSAIGLDLKDFVHEGNGAIWNLALETGPAPHAGWMLVEEVAEGGDVLAARLRRDPAFGRGMTRVCDGGGVALYRRTVMQNAKGKMQAATNGHVRDVFESLL